MPAVVVYTRSLNPHLPKHEPPASWRDRLRALRNLPPLLAMVWETSPFLATVSLLARLLWALVPLGMLWVAKLLRRPRSRRRKRQNRRS